MPWIRPTLQQLYERIGQDFSGRLLDGGRMLSRSVISVLSKIWAGAAHEMHGMLAWLFLQVFVDTAEGPYLERWARVWGVLRKPAASAAGSVVFSGLDGVVVPAGTLVQYEATGAQYYLQADALIADGTAEVAVLALDAGVPGDLPAGAELSLTAPIAGVQSRLTVSGAGMSGGAEEEDDDSLRARLLARLRKPARGGAKHDYEFWALEVPGVTRAWCYPLGMGIGTVSLTFVTDNAPGGPIPTQEMVERVQEHIDVLRPVTVKEFQAYAPSILPVTVRVAVTPNTAAVRKAVEAELDDMMHREAKPDTTILLSHFHEAVSLAVGETDHSIFLPSDDIHVPPGAFPILHPVEFIGG
jgi:uncharacterized phage protein gp47/JayE